MPYKICTIQVKLHNYPCEPDSNFMSKAMKVIRAVEDLDYDQDDIKVIDYKLGDKQNVF